MAWVCEIIKHCAHEGYSVIFACNLHVSAEVSHYGSFGSIIRSLKARKSKGVKLWMCGFGWKKGELWKGLVKAYLYIKGNNYTCKALGAINKKIWWETIWGEFLVFSPKLCFVSYKLSYCNKDTVDCFRIMASLLYEKILQWVRMCIQCNSNIVPPNM